VGGGHLERPTHGGGLAAKLGREECQHRGGVRRRRPSHQRWGRRLDPTEPASVGRRTGRAIGHDDHPAHGLGNPRRERIGPLRCPSTPAKDRIGLSPIEVKEIWTGHVEQRDELRPGGVDAIERTATDAALLVRGPGTGQSRQGRPVFRVGQGVSR
jgi:hypothetical protein